MPAQHPLADQPQHTPGPFTAEPGSSRGAWIKGSDGSWLCLACGDTDEQAEANIAFIVSACSALAGIPNPADYIASLEKAVEELLIAHDCADETGYVDDVGFIDIDAIKEHARKTLALKPKQP